MKKNILVLCTGNSCRSQIAEGYLRYFVKEKAIVYSAGVETHGVNPKAIATMKEDGIDISNHTSNNIDEYRDIDFDFIITCATMQKKSALSSQVLQRNFTITFKIRQKLLEQMKKSK